MSDDRENTSIPDTASIATVLDVGWPEVYEPPPLGDGGGADDRIRLVAAGEFPALAVPEDFGGTGLSILGVASAQRALARVDPGVAIALNMHSLSIGLMTEYWQRHRDKSWMLLEGLAGSHALVASAFAEPGGSANFMRSRSVAVPTDDGKAYIVNGTKFPCSLATTATLFCLSARVAGTDETIVALCHARSPGLEIGAAWDSLGMRGSDTARVSLVDVEIDDRLVFHRAPASDADRTVIDGLVWFSVLLAATYHGMLTSLAEHAVAAIDRVGARPSGRRQALLGASIREILTLGATCQHVAKAWTAQEIAGPAALAAAMTLRAAVSDARERTVARLTPVLGSRLYTASDPACRLAIDLLAANHHPPNLLACDQVVGAIGLGLPVDLDLDD